MSSSACETHSEFIKMRVIKLQGLQNIKISSQINYYFLKFNNVSKKFCYNESDHLDFIVNLNSSDLSYNLELLACFSNNSIQNLGYISILNILNQNKKEICFQKVNFTLPDYPSTKSVSCQLVIHSLSNEFKYKPLKEFSKSDFLLDESEPEQKDDIILETEEFTLFAASHIKNNKKYIIKQYKLGDINKIQNTDQKKFLTVSDIKKIRSTSSYDALLQVVGFIRSNESEILQSGVQIKQRSIKIDAIEQKPVQKNEEGNPYWAILEGKTSVSDFDFDDPNPKVIENLNAEGNPIWSILAGEKAVRERDIILEPTTTTNIDPQLLQDQDEDDQIVSCIVYSNTQHESSSSSSKSKKNIITLHDLIYNRDKKITKYGNNNKTRIMYEITHALYRMHYQGNVHRHLNPSNILINTKSLKVKLFDYEVSSEIIGKDLNGIYYKQENHYNTAEKQTKNIHNDFASDIFSLGLIFFEIATGKKKDRKNDFDFIQLSSNLRFMCHKMIDPVPYNRPYVEEVLYLFKSINFGIYDTNTKKFNSKIEKLEKSIPKGLSFLMQYDQAQIDHSFSNYSGLFAFKLINDDYSNSDDFLDIQKEDESPFIDSLLGHLLTDGNEKIEKNEELGSKLLEQAYSSEEEPDYHFCLFNFDDINSSEEPSDFSLWWQYQQIRTGMIDSSIYFCNLAEGQIKAKYIDHLETIIDNLRKDCNENPYVCFSYGVLLKSKDCPLKNEEEEEIEDLIQTGVDSYVTPSLSALYLKPTEKYLEKKLVGAVHNSNDVIQELTFYYNDTNDLKEARKFAKIGSSNKISLCEQIRGEIYQKEGNDKDAQKYFDLAKKHSKVDINDIDFEFNSDDEKQLKKSDNTNNQRFAYNSDDDQQAVDDDDDEAVGHKYKMKTINLLKSEGDEFEENDNASKEDELVVEEEEMDEDEVEDNNSNNNNANKEDELVVEEEEMDEDEVEDNNDNKNDEKVEPQSEKPTQIFLGAAPPNPKHNSELDEIEEEEEDVDEEEKQSGIKVEVFGDIAERATIGNNENAEEEEEKEKEKVDSNQQDKAPFEYKLKVVQVMTEYKERSLRNKSFFDEQEDDSENSNVEEDSENLDDVISAVNESDHDGNDNDDIFDIYERNDDDDDGLETKQADTETETQSKSIDAEKQYEETNNEVLDKQPEIKDIDTEKQYEEINTEVTKDQPESKDVNAEVPDKQPEEKDINTEKQYEETNNEVLDKQPEEKDINTEKQYEEINNEVTKDQPEGKDASQHASSLANEEPDFLEVKQRSLTIELFDDTIESLISQRDAASLIRYLHEKDDHDLTNSVFNRLYSTDRPFYADMIQEGVKLNNAVSLHKKALSLIQSGTKEDIKTARRLLETSINLGFNLSYFTLSRLVHEIYNQNELAFKLAREGAARNEKYSRALLGYYMAKGIGIQKQEERGILLMLASDAEDFYERYSTDIALYFIEKDDKENAFKWFERAYSIGKTKASVNNIGICYMRGIGTKKDSDRAFQIFTSNGQIGEPTSTYYKACIVESSDSENSEEESLRLFKEAAENGSVDAQAHYAYLMRDKDPEVSMKYFELAAKKGHVASQVCLGFLKENEDADISLALYKKAAERGSSKAQAYLAMKYSRENDTENTFKYMRMCVRTGQDIVPLEYAKFLYDKKNFKLALQYFQLVATVNNPIARFFIGVMKFKGEGCDRNRDEAYQIMKALADQKIERAAQFIEDYYE